MATGIQEYGADWCGLTFGVWEYLTHSHLAYDYYDVDRDPHAQDFVIALNDGRRRLPVVVVQEIILTNPTLVELRQLLDDHSVRSELSASREIARRERSST